MHLQATFRAIVTVSVNRAIEVTALAAQDCRDPHAKAAGLAETITECHLHAVSAVPLQRERDCKDLRENRNDLLTVITQYSTAGQGREKLGANCFGRDTSNGSTIDVHKSIQLSLEVLSCESNV